MAKFCTHCGKKISDNALFCKYCGAKADVEEATRKAEETAASKSNVVTREPPVKKAGKSFGDEGLPKNMKIIIAVAIALVMVTAGIGAVMYFGKSNDSVPPSNTETEEKTDEIFLEETQEEPSDNQDKGVESKGKSAENSPNNSRYRVGETYTVQTNLRVREGPGKTYRILDRSELTPEDYANSVDSKTTTDALMEKGKRITCLEMSGNWMRISSGWVCVEDEGEVLVR